MHIADKSMLFLGSVLNARLSFAVENLSCGPVKGSNTNQDVAYLADNVWACIIWISCLSSLNLVFSLTNYLPSVLPWKCFCPACKALNSYLSCFILDCTHFSWQCGQLCMKAGCYMGNPPPQRPSPAPLYCNSAWCLCSKMTSALSGDRHVRF